MSGSRPIGALLYLSQRYRVAWKGSKVYVPSALRVEVLRWCHDIWPAGHFGFLKTLQLTNHQFWWPRLKQDVEEYVHCCVTFTTMKKQPGKPPRLLQPVASPLRPWEEIAMDFTVDLLASQGKTVIWTVIDLFSKQAHFVACEGLPSTCKLAKMFIAHIYRLHGVLQRVISDRGVQFTARFWHRFLTMIGSTQGLSSAFHLATNVAAETTNVMIEQYLRCYIKH